MNTVKPTPAVKARLRSRILAGLIALLLFIALSIAGFAVASSTIARSIARFAGLAVSVPPPARIVLGLPKHVMAGYESIEYPVLITNTSQRKIWFHGVPREPPSYRRFILAPDDGGGWFHHLFVSLTHSESWTDQTMFRCGLGSELQGIAPGASIAFTVSVSGEEMGHQLRVELPIYESSDYRAKPVQIASEPTAIK